MGEIRRFEEEHIPEVAALELKVFHGRREKAGPALEQYFAEIFFRNPWRGYDLPSLVYLHGGRIVAFVGVVPRPMKFNGREILVGVASQLIADTEAFRGFAGVDLAKHFLDGPQDLSFTDGATEAGCAVWTAMGAKVARLNSLEWLRVLRPARYFQGKLSQHRKAGVRVLAPVVFPACWLADAALSRLPLHALSSPVTELRGEPASAEELLRCMNEIGWRDALTPSYDPASFQWLLSQAASARNRGELRTVVVCDQGGARVGWYVYYAKRGGVFIVLQIGAATSRMEDVLLDLCRDAWAQGAVAVRGRVRPRHLLDFYRGHCSFHYPGNGVLVHSRDPQLMACVLQGEAALTRLDGEWWMRFADTDWS